MTMINSKTCVVFVIMFSGAIGIHVLLKDKIICENGRKDSWQEPQGTFEKVECAIHFDTCETKFEIQGARLTVSKRCVKNDSCEGNAKGNPTNCYQDHQLERNERVCYFCCHSNDCNHYEFVPSALHFQVILRRTGTLDYDRNWEAYKNGFGEQNGEYWAGLNHIHDVTEYYDKCFLSAKSLLDSRISRAVWGGFAVSSEENHYQASSSSYRKEGLKTNFFPTRKVIPFSTYDVDNDRNARNCADFSNGGWWYLFNCRGLTEKWHRLDAERVEMALYCHNYNY